MNACLCPIIFSWNYSNICLNNPIIEVSRYQPQIFKDAQDILENIILEIEYMLGLSLPGGLERAAKTDLAGLRSTQIAGLEMSSSRQVANRQLLAATASLTGVYIPFPVIGEVRQTAGQRVTARRHVYGLFQPAMTRFHLGTLVLDRDLSGEEWRHVDFDDLNPKVTKAMQTPLGPLGQIAAAFYLIQGGNNTTFLEMGWSVSGHNRLTTTPLAGGLTW